MSTVLASRMPHPALPARPTLANVLELILADPDLASRQRQDMASALRTIAKALGRPPTEVPAHPLYLWERLQKFAPAAVGLTEGRWRNVRSSVRAALKRVGLAYVPGRYREPRHRRGRICSGTLTAPSPASGFHVSPATAGQWDRSGGGHGRGDRQVPGRPQAKRLRE